MGHTKDVLSVAFSSDNRQIVSGSRDKTIKLWNTLGVCKYTVQVSWGKRRHKTRLHTPKRNLLGLVLGSDHPGFSSRSVIQVSQPCPND